MIELLNFILLICAGVGLSHILVDGSIIAPFKFWLSNKNNWFYNNLLQILNCHQCSGFYAGIIVYIIYRISPLLDNWLDLILWGFAISILSLGTVIKFNNLNMQTNALIGEEKLGNNNE